MLESRQGYRKTSLQLSCKKMEKTIKKSAFELIGCVRANFKVFKFQWTQIVCFRQIVYLGFYSLFYISIDHKNFKNLTIAHFPSNIFLLPKTQHL